VAPVGSVMYQFQHKLKYIKEKIKKWNQEVFRNILQAKKQIEKQLEEIQSISMAGDLTEDIREKERILLLELNKTEKQEEIMWKQKSRNHWLREGDRNTHFFHKLVVQNRHQNRIVRLQRQGGIFLDTQEDLE